MKLVYTLLCLFFCFVLTGQNFTVTVAVMDEVCVADGSASITISGGSGDFRFQLSSECGETFAPQTVPTFTALAACKYGLVTTDRGSGLTVSSEFTVEPNGNFFSVATTFLGCDAVAIATGGSGPYLFEYTVDGGGEVSQTSPDSLLLPGLDGRTAAGTVFDQCGNSRPFSMDGGGVSVSGFSTEQSNAGVLVKPKGGIEPFTFTLNSSVGVFTNGTGSFTYAEIGCNPTIEIQGACENDPFVRDLNLKLDAAFSLSCVNFSTGTAEVTVGAAAEPPFVFKIVADGVEITSSDPIITGIPPGTRRVTLEVTDGCGNTIEDTAVFTPNRLITPSPALDCNDTSLALSVGRACGTNTSLPVNITCETCPGSPELTQTKEDELMVFANGTDIGNYRIRVEDACGDIMTCQDTILLEVIPACDSIIANLIQRFNCESGTISRRVIQDPGNRYFLSSAGVPVKDNATGRFTNLPPGNYTVRVENPCTTPKVADVTLGGSTSIDPAITVEPNFEPDGDGECRVSYQVSLRKDGGPYQIRGLDDPSFSLVLNDFGLDDCEDFIFPSPLFPGRYEITSLSLCGNKVIELPDIVQERIDTVEINSICPEGATVTITAERRTVNNWRNFYRGFGYEATIRGQRDYYVINGQIYRTDVITGLPPGDYVVGVGAGFERQDCLLDTFSFTIPTYEPVELMASDNYLCANSGEAPFSIVPIKGSGPYEIREVDGDDPTQTIRSFTVVEGDSLELIAVQKGVLNFVVEDACGVTFPLQVEVRDLEDELNLAYICEPATARLFTDTIDGVFTWFDQSNSVVGGSNDITVAPSGVDQTYSLEVQTATCLLTAEVSVPGRDIIPSLTISPSATDGTYLSCNDGEFSITATTDDFSTISWSDSEPPGSSIAVLIPFVTGEYTATAVNDLGCVADSIITFIGGRVPTPMIRPAGDNCPGGTQKIGIESPPGSTVSWNDGQQAQDTIALVSEGVNTVVVTSDEGCVGVDTLAYFFPVPISFTAVGDSVSCFGVKDGRISVAASGGTGALVFGYGDGVLLDVGELASGLDAGEYSIGIQDENGCLADTALVIGQPDSLQLELQPNFATRFGETINLPLLTNANLLAAANADGVEGDFDLANRSFTFRAVSSTRLLINITDAIGCTASAQVNVVVNDAKLLYSPTAFSPNGDGVNDFFTLQGGDSDIARIELLQVYDRWGGMVYEQTDASINELSSGWAGVDRNSQPADSGTYVWRAKVIYFDGSNRTLSGVVNLLR
ncbi:T9SS type B sorting domain-containing protein [Neolewinella antarctica]|uniref:Gliding motility-associated-like protein n=1 Tax=Neolewinella antarctica TaxID=442734 RepID=A0ABX0X915_9BACT|nr:gliding motility-associated C-terminal domain-containing protein [Neolewinella antarctica]NJC25277.1 gliding motility-associated-like protein [Neolewinella antarctica]